MTTKERAVLRGLASTYEATVTVGKGGITENVVEETMRSLKAHELVKGRVLDTALLSAREVLAELAEKTGAEPVQAIGSKFVLYKENKSIPEEKRIKLSR